MSQKKNNCDAFLKKKVGCEGKNASSLANIGLTPNLFFFPADADAQGPTVGGGHQGEPQPPLLRGRGHCAGHIYQENRIMLR